jgi:hypothetical protein
MDAKVRPRLVEPVKLSIYGSDRRSQNRRDERLTLMPL